MSCPEYKGMIHLQRLLACIKNLDITRLSCQPLTMHHYEVLEWALQKRTGTYSTNALAMKILKRAAQSIPALNLPGLCTDLQNTGERIVLFGNLISDTFITHCCQARHVSNTQLLASEMQAYCSSTPLGDELQHSKVVQWRQQVKGMRDDKVDTRSIYKRLKTIIQAYIEAEPNHRNLRQAMSLVWPIMDQVASPEQLIHTYWSCVHIQSWLQLDESSLNPDAVRTIFQHMSRSAAEAQRRDRDTVKRPRPPIRAAS